MEPRTVSIAKFDPTGTIHSPAIVVGRERISQVGMLIRQQARPVDRDSWEQLQGSFDSRNLSDDLKVVMTENQFDNFILMQNQPTHRYFVESPFGMPLTSDHAVLSFSYGAGLGVNRKLAEHIYKISSGVVSEHKSVSVFAQWEIADDLSMNYINRGTNISRISINPAPTDGHSGYRIKDIPALANTNLFGGITAASNEAECANAINTLLNSTSFSEENVGLVGFNTPIGNATRYLTREQKPLRSGAVDIPQLNLALLMGMVSPEHLDIYIDSIGVINKFKETASTAQQQNVYLVAQSWHAARLLRTCANMGLNVTGGALVDAFATGDSQVWTDNVICWLTKEGGVFKAHPEFFPE